MNYFVKEPEKKGSIVIHNFLPEIGIDNARTEIIEGLNSRSKYISPKFFYNKEGSALFEKITKLKEYYPTRSEKEILSDLIGNLEFDFKNLDIIELGSGDASKISLVFEQLSPHLLETINYYAIDIDQSAIEKSIEQITAEYDVNCTGIVTDFYHHLKLIPSNRRRLFCFFGGTIGNFSPQETEVFLKQLGSIMKSGDALLLGADLIKDISTLELAYNDKKKITEAFNKNILNTVNTLLSSTINAAEFEHIAFYNVDKSRIEMHLKALKNQTIRSKYILKTIEIKKGETIHTENSHKFNENHLKQFGSLAELTLESVFFDSQKHFSLAYYLKY
jgi:L-histidine N-alpha-methyltransferase